MTDSGLASVFLLLGVVLLVPGFAAFGWWLVRTRHVAVRVVTAAAAVVAFFVLFDLLDSIGKNFADDTSYWQDEIGILLTAVLAGILAAITAVRGQASTLTG